MTVPAYTELMLPLLKYISDGSTYRSRQIIDELAVSLKLSEADLSEMLPSGKQTYFNNRIGWANTYLKKAGLIESVGKGEFRITTRGKDVLNENPSLINAAYLKRFSEFEAFISNKSESPKNQQEEFPLNPDEIDPREALEINYKKIKDALAEQLLETVKQASPRFFERLVVDLIVSMGYGGSRQDAMASLTPYTNDGGVDGIIKEDKLGLEVIYIQAKRWEASIGRPAVQAFAGSLEGFRAKKGVLITTSGFSKDAQEYVKQIEKKIILIDGKQLTEYMIDYNVGVNERDCYLIKDIDMEYFELV